MVDKTGKPISQRQLRVGEMIKQSLGMIFARNEAKVPNLETNTVTVTEVKMSQDLKIAKAYVLPLGGKDTEKVIKKLREYSFLIRKALSQKVVLKYMPKIFFAKDALSFIACLWNIFINVPKTIGSLILVSIPGIISTAFSLSAIFFASKSDALLERLKIEIPLAERFLLASACKDIKISALLILANLILFLNGK